MERFQRAEPNSQGLLEESEVISLMRDINGTITTAVICQKLKVTPCPASLRPHWAPALKAFLKMGQ